MATPFPDPRSLLASLVTLERTLADFERTRAGQSFTSSSSDGTVSVNVNGIGRVVSVSIDSSQLALPLQTLADKVKTVANAAIDAASASSAAAATSFAGTLTLPGLPARTALTPDFPDFVMLADTLSAQILANNPCQSTDVFQCQAGRVVATVDAHRRVVSLTYLAPAPRFASYLETRTVEALNCAIDKGTRRKKDTDAGTGGIVDSFGLGQLVLYAKGSLKLNDRVTVRKAGCTDWATVANAGTIETNLGSNTELGNVVSRAKVTLRGSRIHGFIHTSDVVDRQNNATVDGAIDEHATVLLPDLALNVPFPGVTQGTIELEPGQTQTAGPAFYNKLSIKRGAVANLSSGVYYFNELFLDVGSTVNLNASAGPIVLWVRNAFTFRGTFVDVAGGFPRVFAGFLASGPNVVAVVESRYQGTLSAPGAKISLSTIKSHEGAFHARDIEIQPDCQVCHHPFELRYDQLPGLLPPGGLPPPTVDLGFETVAGWSSPQTDLLTSVQNPVTQGTRSLQITNVPGLVEIVSAAFSADLAPNGATRAIVDLWIPAAQPNPSNVGTASLIISAPSANVNAVNLGTVALTSLPRNHFSQLEFALPTAVRNALDTTRSDVSVKLSLNVTAGSGPWLVDNIRFLLPPPAISTLDPILSFEDQSKWSCAQTALTTSTTNKTNLQRSLQITTAPGRIRGHQRAVRVGADQRANGQGPDRRVGSVESEQLELPWPTAAAVRHSIRRGDGGRHIDRGAHATAPGQVQHDRAGAARHRDGPDQRRVSRREDPYPAQLGHGLRAPPPGLHPFPVTIDPAALLERAEAAAAAGRLPWASQLCDAALNGRPPAALAAALRVLRAEASLAAGAWTRAERECRRALGSADLSRTRAARAHDVLARCRLHARDGAGAAHAIEAALACGADGADVWCLYAHALSTERRHDQAEAAGRAAFARAPTVATRAMLVHVLAAAGKHQEVIRFVDAELPAHPRDAELWTALGFSLNALGPTAAGVAALREALAIDPRRADAGCNLGVALLRLGDLAEGFRFHEHRQRDAGMCWRLGIPPWRGEPLGHGHLLVLAEQGLGDTIQFARFVPSVRTRAARVTFVVPPPLVRLFGSNSQLGAIASRPRRFGGADVQTLLMSLPHLLGPDSGYGVEALPSLWAEPDRVARWRAALPAWSKIAIAWQGNPAYAGEPARSMPFRYFEPLFERAGRDTCWLSLQKNFGREQVAAAASAGRVVDLGGRIDDGGDAFIDSLAILSLADLFVTTDTALAHLAGSAGIPTWVLLTHGADWRWGVEAEATGWYPTVRLFRQTAPGDWAGVIQRVGDALDARRAGSGTRQSARQSGSKSIAECTIPPRLSERARGRPATDRARRSM